MYSAKDCGTGENGIRHRQLVLEEQVDGRPIALPLVELVGASSGPTMLLVAGQQGVELNGMVSIGRVLRALDVAGLRGRVLAAPIANSPAFLRGAWDYPPKPNNPTWVQQMHWPEGGPADSTKHWDRHMNRQWPGKPDGNVTQQITHAIYQEAGQYADFGVDLHSHFYWNSEVGILQAWNQPAVEFGRALGAPVNHRSEGYDGQLSMVLATRGAPALTIELVGVYVVNETTVREGVRMIHNALKYAGMIDGEPEMPETVYEFPYEAEKPVITKGTGLLSVPRRPLEVVRKGELLAEVVDAQTYKTADRITAPYDCIVSRAAWNAYVEKGWAVCKIVDIKESRWQD